MQSQLCLWGVKGDHLYTWTGDYRVRDCAISVDGRRLIAISTDNRIFVYNLLTREEEYCIKLHMDITCINISRDCKYILVNMSSSVVQLLDIETAEVVRQYCGQKQGNYIIRSTFGGASENFVVSGSEGESSLLPCLTEMSDSNVARFQNIRLAQAELHTRRSPRGPLQRLRECSGLEPAESRHVRVGR